MQIFFRDDQRQTWARVLARERTQIPGLTGDDPGWRPSADNVLRCDREELRQIIFYLNAFQNDRRHLETTNDVENGMRGIQ